MLEHTFGTVVGSDSTVEGKELNLRKHKSEAERKLKFSVFFLKQMMKLISSFCIHVLIPWLSVLRMSFKFAERESKSEAHFNQ